MNFPGAALVAALVAVVLSVGGPVAAPASPDAPRPAGRATVFSALPVSALPVSAVPAAGVPTAGGEPSPQPPGDATPAQPSPARPVDCDKVKCIALTFDDGPVRQTAQVLDALKAHNARATFFVLGTMARQHPGLLRRMLAEGNAIGNHSWNHPQFSSMSSAAVRRQIARTNAVIRKATGVAPTMMRPPFGQQNGRIRAVIRGFGDAVVLWNIDTQDWKRSHRHAKYVTKYVVSHARRNAIVLMHDIRPSTRAAVPAIIEKLQAKGYTLVTVPELVGHRPKAGRVYTRG